MVEQQSGAEKRAHPRITWSFMTRFRAKNADNFGWDFPIVRDVSEGGCFFYSSQPCKVGELLDIEIQFPLMGEYMKFVGEVKRVEEDNKIKLAKFGLGIQFLELEENKKDKFLETLDFFLRKQQTQKTS